MTIPLATHGYIWPRDVPVLVEGIHPDAETTDLHPEIMSRSCDAPRFKIQPTRPVRPSIRPSRPKRRSSAKGGR